MIYGYLIIVNKFYVMKFFYFHEKYYIHAKNGFIEVGCV